MVLPHAEEVEGGREAAGHLHIELQTEVREDFKNMEKDPTGPSPG